MRTAKEKDYWERVYRVSFKYAINSINLNGINGINELVLNDGLIAISGLNGVGKSTVIAAIKDLLGYEKTKTDEIKISNNKVFGRIRMGRTEVECENSDGNRAIDKGILNQSLKYIDHDRVTKTQEFLMNQTNIDEFIEQYDEYMLDENDLNELSYIIGKKYTKCSIREIEGDDLEEAVNTLDTGTFPVFNVTQNGVEYDTSKMGVGEHYLCFLFWQLNSLETNDIIIIEEPETFISIFSQKNVINYLASIITEKKITVILTTHSPYILQRIRNENIRVMSGRGRETSILTPTEELSAVYLLGIEDEEYGTIFVEDQVAQEFLIAILQDKKPEILRKYNIDIASGGETAITDRLSIKCSKRMKYKFIGVYDGDMTDKIAGENLNWPYCFMPCNKAIEIEFKEYLSVHENVKTFSKSINKREEILTAILARNDGMNHHDWFLELCKGVSLDPQSMINSYYLVWKDIESEKLATFLMSFERCLLSKCDI
jgi:ABC-type cobalamin/Fe3+-siderophores transport system ATPase subunit